MGQSKITLPWLMMVWILLNGMWAQVFRFNLISRVITYWLLIYDRDWFSQFLGNRNWTQETVKRLNYLLLMMHHFIFCGLYYLFNGRGKIFTRAYCIKTKIVQLFWRLILKGVQVRESRRWIFVNFYDRSS